MLARDPGETRTLQFRANEDEEVPALLHRLGEAPATWFVRFARVVGFTAIFIGVTLLVLTLTAYFD